MTQLRNVAVILAGGTGTRVGLSIPKQLIKIAGKTIIEHTIAAFEASPLIDEIVILMTPGHLDPVRAIVQNGGYDKVSQIVEGGQTRNESTSRALEALGSEECNVLFHDAVRPLVSQTIIGDVVAALATHEAVDTAIPSADTIVQVHDTAAGGTETIEDVLQRHLLRRGQTPQAFRLSVIREAYALAWKDPDFTATDDCTVVLRYLPHVPIAVVMGHERNMKVTEPIDVYIADKLFQLQSADTPDALTDEQYRAALAGKTMVVFGGSYGIGGDIAELARGFGANVHTFSRSSTNTHVDRREDIAAAAAAVLEQTDTIDFVVNTAGVLVIEDLADTSEETIFAATEINYLAPIFIAQEFYPHLAQAAGSLLLFTSSSYTRGRGGYSLYSSAKAAVVNLTQALADEWAGEVRVNCVNPERTGTPMRTKAFGEEPEGTLLSSMDVARQSLDVLLSQQTGHIIDIRREDGPAAIGGGR
ncbi:SDR family NAD(P)-dependent oxidoreductase [Aeromicrobium sp. SMF47]|uniref:2-C-methyl-D-erythritol 4-phosphate cytidylyltransferase n=1 Tax=Aeromicrobium yanjiei TaxID=2662028 RepID=A0A5Q2MCP0_9ACTN|nr:MULTISPECIES: bifunctional cytidylyltransferase/SDR family oxidoreductase [Aeromicrobium]MRJ78067.1 SDR family NAD(P)-dependent oxidoreductase [Aeromicrobium yanjiei]MRK03305.1 SDR family NAD(P)-dependent oxidoreductase [Aeromicrobium sp. S22]QGG40857.1 SDR family NAD(P)-dependent oxidoreductase [Aeromicrobium yanjiei]